MPIHPLVAKPYNILTPIPEDADPKDAFFCIPVHSSSQYLFAFEWNNPDLCHMQQNTWTVLPQGFGSSPHLFVSVQFSRSVMSNSLQSHESQHARPPCPSPTPKVHSDSRPLSQWWHPAISSSVVPFSSCSQATSNLMWYSRIIGEEKNSKYLSQINIKVIYMLYCQNPVT